MGPPQGSVLSPVLFAIYRQGAEEISDGFQIKITTMFINIRASSLFIMNRIRWLVIKIHFEKD